MKQQSLIPPLILSALLSAPALAADRDPLADMESLLNPGILLGGLVADSDVSLLFTHLRASLLAASQGREPPPVPAALTQRMDAAGGELRVRGTLLGLALSQIIERSARDALRDFAQPAPRNAD